MRFTLSNLNPITWEESARRPAAPQYWESCDMAEAESKTAPDHVIVRDDASSGGIVAAYYRGKWCLGEIFRGTK